jgi:hypothetical protein
MNLTNQPVYAKGQKRKRRSRPPNDSERRHWDRIRSLGCCICQAKNPEVHHCGTGGGGRKDHMKVIGLCHFHHRGEQGIHTMGRKVWGVIYGTESEHLERVSLLLR